MLLREQYLGFLKTSSLWKDRDLFYIYQFDFRKPQETNIIPETIPVIISSNEVLGKRIEHFFEYYIDSISQYTLVLKNLQIFKNKITIGEIDFIIKDNRREKLLHIELVYKFYLYLPQSNVTELEKWIGPNKKDRLVDKVNKLKEKQLPLLYHPETKAVLKKKHIDYNNITQQVCFLGNLFVPLSYKNKTLAFVNNDCIVGFWIYSQEFTIENYGDQLFFIPNKQDWITDPKNNYTWFSFTTIIEEIKNLLLQKKAPLLWMKNGETSFSVFFVVWW